MSNSAFWTLQDAKARFSQVVAAAVRGQVQRVTKHGKEAVVIVSAAEFSALQSGRVTVPASFVDHLLAMPRQTGSRKAAPDSSVVRRSHAGRAQLKLRELDLT